jgi:hypothetical protein
MVVTGRMGAGSAAAAALGGEAVAQPARGGLRSAAWHLDGRRWGFPSGGLGGRWAVLCSEGSFGSLFITAAAYGSASAAVLWSVADGGVRRPPASSGQAWGGEGGGGLLGSTGSRYASR